MKILAVSRNFPNSVRPYEGTWAYTQFKALQECGADVRVFSPRVINATTFINRSEMSYAIHRPKKWEYKGLVVDGPVFPYWLGGSRFRHTFAAQTYWGLRRYLGNLYRQWPFDAVYTQAIYPDATAFLRFAHNKRIAVCGCVIGQAEVTVNVQNPGLREVLSATLKNMDLVVAESRSVAQSAEDFIGGVRPVYPAWRGTFPEDIQIDPKVRNDWKEKLALKSENVIVMFVGHIYTAKGVFDLLNAFHIVSKDFPEAKLIYVGTGDQESVLHKQILSLSLNNRVILTGVVPYAHVPSLMSLSDMICSPSHYEGLGLVNVEAGFMRKPVVGARTGGIPEAVSDGHTGLLFEPKNVQDLASKLRTLLSNETLRKQMGEQGYDFVNQYHNAHETTKELYRRICQAVEGKKAH